MASSGVARAEQALADTAAWVSAGAGVMFLGVGITAQVLTSAKYDEFNDVPPEGMCNKTLKDSGGGPCQGLLDAAELRQKVAIAGFAAAGASLAGALLFYLAAPSSPRNTMSRLLAHLTNYRGSLARSP